MIVCATNYSSACVTVVFSFNLQFCTLNADPLEVGVPRVCVLATSICISVRVKVCTWADNITHSKFNTALLPLLLTWVVRQNLVWTSFLVDFHFCDGVCFHTQCRSCASGQVPKSEDLYPPWTILVFTTVAIFSINSRDLDIQCSVYSCWQCLL